MSAVRLTLTDLSLRALALLQDAPDGLTQREFAEHLMPDATTAVGARRSAGTLIGKLEKAQLVKLMYDARRWVYRITPAGRAVLEDR